MATLLNPDTGLAQSLGGTSWQGTLVSSQNEALTYPATVTFRIDGTQLTGSVIMEGQGVKELYVLQGVAQGGQAAGTATFSKDGSVFQFEAQLNGAQLAFVVGLQNTPIMAGTFARLGTGGRTASPQTRNVPDQQRAVPADKLPRNNRLVGAWVHASYYSSSGFSGSTRNYRYFYPDGRLGFQSGQASASYSGADGSSNVGSGADGVTIEQGVVWYTKGKEIWIHVTQQPIGAKVPDQKWAEFYINDNGSGMHLNLGKGNILYERM